MKVKIKQFLKGLFTEVRFFYGKKFAIKCYSIFCIRLRRKKFTTKSLTFSDIRNCVTVFDLIGAR